MSLNKIAAKPQNFLLTPSNLLSYMYHLEIANVRRMLGKSKTRFLSTSLWPRALGNTIKITLYCIFASSRSTFNKAYLRTQVAMSIK